MLVLVSSWATNNQGLVSGFVAPQSPLIVRNLGSTGTTNLDRNRRILPLPSNTPPSLSSSALQMAPILHFIKSATVPLTTPLAKRILLVLGAAVLFLSKQYKKIFWPGSSPDSSLQEPLPPGSMGCPLFGSNVMAGSRDYGPYVFFSSKTFQKYKNPALIKFYAFGMPSVSVTGSDNIKAILKDEFDPNGVNTELVGDAFQQVFGDESVLYEGDKAKHGMLRRLVGSAMTPAAITSAVPAIQQAANNQVDYMLTQETVKMEDVCNDFTLDVAWKQILGLDLSQEEVPIFRQKVKDWVSGLFNPLFIVPFAPGIQFTKCFKARKYLENLVEEKLAVLDETGPDGSTLSGIYFATDDDGDSRKLTRNQVIDNALILIVAGSETSASTLTVASLALGLHPDVWNKIKQEQAAMIAKCGTAITSKAQLDAETPYLDAVIKETLRIRPIPSMELRRTKKSIVLNGMQIPKNWMIWFNIRSTHDTDPVTMEEDGSHMDMKQGYKPERWMNDDTKPSQWLPFGSGARRCLGENLAMTEMKVFLATLARRVDYDLVGPTDKLQWKRMSIMPQPLDGVEVAARPVPVLQAPASVDTGAVTL